MTDNHTPGPCPGCKAAYDQFSHFKGRDQWQCGTYRNPSTHQLIESNECLEQQVAQLKLANQRLRNAGSELYTVAKKMWSHYLSAYVPGFASALDNWTKAADAAQEKVEAKDGTDQQTG